MIDLKKKGLFSKIFTRVWPIKPLYKALNIQSN